MKFNHFYLFTQCFHLPPGFWPMGGQGISPVPHFTITSPLVNRLCSYCWNCRRCQSPHKGCRLTLITNHHQGTWALTGAKLTSDPATSITSIQMRFVFSGLTYMTPNQKYQSLPGLLETLLCPQLGNTIQNLFSYQTPEHVPSCRCMRIKGSDHL